MPVSIADFGHALKSIDGGKLNVKLCFRESDIGSMGPVTEEEQSEEALRAARIAKRSRISMKMLGRSTLLMARAFGGSKKDGAAAAKAAAPVAPAKRQVGPSLVPTLDTKQEPDFSLGKVFIAKTIPVPTITSGNAKPWTDRSGFNVYLDSCRFLPSICTVARVNYKVLTKRAPWHLIGEEVYAVADSKSPVLCPKYNHYTEYHGGFYDPTCTLVIRVETVEAVTGNLRVVGYALLNIFVQRADVSKQPTDSASKDVLLNEGCFQLPLRQRPPRRSDDMTSSCLDDHHRVSAATVLVRVERAKTGPDGRSLLSAEGPSADAQTKAKLITPPPDYESGAYDSSRAKPLPCEQERYRSIERMLASGHPDVMETVLDSFQKYNPNELDVDTQPEFEVWWDHQPAKPSDMLNYNKVAKFDPQAGFFFAVDGILRAPQSLCKVVFSLSPPGNFYSKTRKLPDNVHFTHDHDWTSSKRFQQFADEPWKFTQIELLGGYNSKLVVIVEVYALTMNITQKNRPPVAAKPWAWTILPVFLKGEPFVATGAYVLPLLKGPPDLDVLNEAMGGGKGPGEAIEYVLALVVVSACNWCVLGS
eukprot:INCI13490.15.p1 GENE.INCI13490.15~~INCI13490.15.p1  ORF type:complete len:589 (-),score=74.84 INCI13490.15:1799-3565(-)